jgi:hypothetical protein
MFITFKHELCNGMTQITFPFVTMIRQNEFQMARRSH